MRFQRAAVIDGDFYLIGLPAAAERVYFYLSSRCQTRFHVPEDEIAKVLKIELKRVRASLNMLVDLNMLKRWKFQRPKCTEYLITLTTEKQWGKGCRRTYSIGCRRTLSWGAGAPNEGVQAHLPTTTTSIKDSDSALFALFRAHFAKWQFNGRSLGRTFHFTGKMMFKAIECMRYLNGLPGFSTDEAFNSFLDSCRDYLTCSKDPLSSHRDMRALSPAKWLNDWPEQIRLAGQYHDEILQKVTHFPTGANGV